METASPRPTFLIPRILRGTGRPRPITATYPAVTGLLRDLLRRSGKDESDTVEEWWNALEPAIVVLTVAGYECPEIVLARPDVPDAYLRLFLRPREVDGTTTDVVVGTGDWEQILPADGAAGAALRFGLRVEARRFLEQPLRLPPPAPQVASPHPPLDLASKVATYRAGPTTPSGSDDPIWADPLDGWITGTQPLTGQVGPAGATRRTWTGDVRDAVAAALGATRTSHAAAGLLTILDPSTWEIPLAQALPIDAFAAAAAEIHAGIATAEGVVYLLTKELGAREASGRALLEAHPGRSAAYWRNPRDELAARQRHFYPRAGNLAFLLDRLEREHWLVVIFTLHEYGLIRVVPSLADPSFLAPPEVVADLPPTDLTGLYETRWGELEQSSGPVVSSTARSRSLREGDARLANATMQLNHVGPYLDGWVTDADLVRVDFAATLDTSTFKPSDGIQKPLLRFRGVFDHAPGSTWIEISDVPYPDDGLLELAISVGFEDGEREAEYTMQRVDRFPRLCPALVTEGMPAAVVAGLGSAPADPLAELQTFVTPVHSHHRAAFGAARMILEDDLYAIFQVLALSKELKETDEKIRRTLTLAGILVDSELPDVVPPILSRFRLEIQASLASVVLEPGWTYWLWLSEVLRRLELSHSPDGDGLQELLDVRPGILGNLEEPDVPGLEHLHTYDYQFSGIGVSGEVALVEHLSAGGFAIQCDLSHRAECAEKDAPQPHAWSEHYLGALFEGEVGQGPEGLAAVNTMIFSDPNEVVTRGEWDQDDFAPCAIVSVAASMALAMYAGIGGEVVPGSDELKEKTGLGLAGLETEGVAFLSGSGWAMSNFTPNDGWGVKSGYGVGAGAAATLGLSIGFLLARGSTDTTSPVTVRTFDATFDASETLTLGEFDIGEWALKEGMRAMVAGNAARYLAVLAAPETILRVEGDASPTGDEAANELLSWKRGLAAYAWLRTLLAAGKSPDIGTTTSLAATPDRVEMIGNGELEARATGQVPNGFESDEWRRVKIVFNDRVIVFL